MRRLLLVLLLVGSLVMSGVAWSAPGGISTVAGSGTYGYSGDGGPATAAAFSYPTDVVFDAAGNLYIADSENQRIRKIDSTGDITTIAGTGTAGYSGDDDPATEAQLNYPQGIAFDATGNLYIADTLNHVIRKVDTTGTITTIAGTGTAGYSGDDDPATEAQLNQPFGVTFDATGSLYIADSNNQRIRKVDTTGTITTVAGTGTAGYSGDGDFATAAQLSYPSAVTFDATGDLYIAEPNNRRIRKVDTTGTITTVAGTGTAGYSGDGGPATAAQLNQPSGVTFDAAGNLYIADYGNHRIRKVDTIGDITTVAGTGTAGYSGDGGPATAAEFNWPSAVTFDTTGNLYIADDENHRIRKVEAADGDGDGHPDAIDNFPGIYSDCHGRQSTIIGTNGPDVLNGTAGDDVIMGRQGADTINGLAGNDWICAGVGDDQIDGGSGRDFIWGGPGADNLDGDRGNDRLFGGPGADTLDGERGHNDRLRGGPGVDTLDGGAGNADRCRGETKSNCELPVE